jgi:hypothetical protein
MTFKGSNWTRGDLGAEPEQDEYIACAECGDEYNFREYWVPRYLEGDDRTDDVREWYCDDCSTQSRHERLNQQLTKFQ